MSTTVTGMTVRLNPCISLLETGGKRPLDNSMYHKPLGDRAPQPNDLHLNITGMDIIKDD